MLHFLRKLQDKLKRTKVNKRIKYRDPSQNSVFAELQIRENIDDAFENAINKGMKNPGNWMYMYSEKGRDYFKHFDTREYQSYAQECLVETKDLSND